MEEYEFVGYAMKNKERPQNFEDDVPDEYFVRGSKLKHFSQNMAVWKEEDT